MTPQTDETINGASKGETYKLTLEGGGLKVNREVDEAVALQVLAAVMGGGGISPTVLSGGTRSAQPSQSRTQTGSLLSLREHMDEFEPKRNPDKILAIAAYLTDTREMETFTPDEVKREFKNASEPVPANYSRDWNWTVANGWIAKSDEPGEFYVTLKGRDALGQKFSNEVKMGTRQGTRRRRTRKKSEPS